MENFTGLAEYPRAAAFHGETEPTGDALEQGNEMTGWHGGVFG